MAISTQDPVLAWRRVANAMHSLKPSTQLVLRAIKSWLVQQGSNPDLQFVPFDYLSASETVIADAAHKVYVLVLQKHNTATATFSKYTDSATTSSDDSADLVIKQNVAKSEAVLFFNTGLAMANGGTMQGNTTASGGTSSGADAANGFVLLGAA
jgi:hypothetical protein